MMLRSRGPVGAALFFGIVSTLVVVFVPWIRFAYESPALHIVLESGEAVVAFFTAVLLLGRFRHERRARDLVLAYVLGLLAGTNLLLGAVPDALYPGAEEVFGVWAPATARLVAGTLLAIAALGPDRRLVDPPRHSGTIVTIACAVTLAVVALAVALLSENLPNLVSNLTPPSDRTRPSIDQDPALVAINLAHVILYVAAALGFGRRARDEDDTFMAWFAAASWLNATARIHYLLFPSLYTDYVYTGDVLRLGFYVLLLVGVVRELQTYWEGRASAAVAEERRHLARDLHDGIAQELVFISAQTKRAQKRGATPEDLARLASAAERAVAESRRAIAALSGADQTLSAAVVELCEEAARASGRDIQHDVAPGVDLPRADKEVVLRIVREAVTNAVRHAGAASICVTLVPGPPLEVLVDDDGAGFDPSQECPGRFGLVSMRERAATVKGQLKVESTPGSGTEVRLTLARAGDRGPGVERL